MTKEGIANAIPSFAYEEKPPDNFWGFFLVIQDNILF